jgi:nicotinate-nucleotide--dimethylbenzimidazole phosphoribosyltransferase
MRLARKRQDSLTKPGGSLGSWKIIGQNSRYQALCIACNRRQAIVVMAADHGVTAEGVSAYPQSVTRKWYRLS